MSIIIIIIIEAYSFVHEYLIGTIFNSRLLLEPESL